MEVKTKFNADQKVYLLINNKVVYRKIDGIQILVNAFGRAGIQYRLDGLHDYAFGFDEKDLFATKEELLKSL